MKKKIHPKYEDSLVFCSCGNKIPTKSTKKNLKIEICSACHPIYTGNTKLIDKAGRIEKFNRRLEKNKKQMKQESQ